MKQVPDDIEERSDVIMDAKCHLKMLVPNHVAGAIIGREGNQIGEILLMTRCQMQISACGGFFPGTYDRILIMSGTMAELEECIKSVLRRVMTSVQQSTTRSGESLLCKLVVPSSAVSGLIGHHGDKVKRLSEWTQCKINVSLRVEGMQERLVLICGPYEQLLAATIFIARELQGDSHMKEHLSLNYSVHVPLGAWAGNRSQPADPQAPLIPPQDALHYSKREVIKYLKQAAPLEILLRHSLLGKIENIMKSKGQIELKAAVEETWDLRIHDIGLDPANIRARPTNPFDEQPLYSGGEKTPLPVGLVPPRCQKAMLAASSGGVSCEGPKPSAGEGNGNARDDPEMLQVMIQTSCFQSPEDPEAFSRLCDAQVRFEDDRIVAIGYDGLGHSKVVVCSNFPALVNPETCRYRIDPDGRNLQISVSMDKKSGASSRESFIDREASKNGDDGSFLNIPAKTGEDKQAVKFQKPEKTRSGISSYADFL